MNPKQMAELLEKVQTNPDVEGLLDDVAVERREAGKAIIRDTLGAVSTVAAIRFVLTQMRILTDDVMERIRDRSSTREDTMAAVKGYRALEDALLVVSENLDRPKESDGNNV